MTYGHWVSSVLGQNPACSSFLHFHTGFMGKRDYERLVEHVMTSNEPGQKESFFGGKYDDIFFLD